jgi:hypothetical protein
MLRGFFPEERALSGVNPLPSGFAMRVCEVLVSLMSTIGKEQNAGNASRKDGDYEENPVSKTEPPTTFIADGKIPETIPEDIQTQQQNHRSHDWIPCRLRQCSGRIGKCRSCLSWNLTTSALGAYFRSPQDHTAAIRAVLLVRADDHLSLYYR